MERFERVIIIFIIIPFWLFEPFPWQWCSLRAITIIISCPATAVTVPSVVYPGCHFLMLRGRIKKLFFYFWSKGGGVSVNPKIPYQKILRFFGPKGGGGLTQSKRVLSDFCHNFCIYLEKYHCICKEVRVCSQAILGCQNSLNLQLVWVRKLEVIWLNVRSMPRRSLWVANHEWIGQWGRFV